MLLLLEGRATAYVFASPGCKKWDTCAPEALLHAVGGKNGLAKTTGYWAGKHLISHWPLNMLHIIHVRF